MHTKTAHVAIYDTLADWEVGHLLAELRTGRYTGTSFDVVTVAESREPVTTMGGVRIVPDALLADLEPSDSDLLVGVQTVFEPEDREAATEAHDRMARSLDFAGDEGAANDPSLVY